MNERVVPGTPKSKTSGKLVQFPGMLTQKSELGFKKYWLIGGLASLLVLGVGIGWWILGAPSTVHYTTAVVSRGAITRGVTATGTVNPELTIIVGAYDSGVIQELYCDYNTPVKKGQVCAKIDPRPYQTVVDQNKANLAVAKAQLEKDKANLAYAKLTLDRDAKLVQTNAVSQDTFDNAKSAYDQAMATITFDEATVQQRQAALDSSQVNLDYADIVSPVDGVVVSRNVTMGQTVASSFQTPTLFLIASDLTKMQVDTNVSESDVGEIKPGGKSTFTVDAYPRRTFEGTVTEVRQSPQTVQNVVTYDIVVSAANSDLALMPGMTTANRIITDQRNDVIRVPNLALRYSPSVFGDVNSSGQAQIWVLRNERPIPVPVAVGLEDDNFTEIISGDVKAGDLVIIAEQRATSSESAIPRLRY
jgi:HlyD family secretion protein